MMMMVMFKTEAPLPYFQGLCKGLIALTLEIDCNQATMGLPSVISAVPHS
jgi:hypothetical protein